MELGMVALAVIEAAAFAASPAGRPILFAAVILRAPGRIFFDKEFPRNEAGKVVRARLAERVRRKAKT